MGLIERIEAAEGPSRELDRAVFDAVTDGVFEPSNSHLWHNLSWSTRAPNHFTSSLDAAMTLVPEKYHDDFAIKGLGKWVGAYLGVDYRDIHGHVHEGEGATPALALCAAALRAREASHAE